ncbi:MAG TPA: hypothetical protein VK928_00990 [Longimicrobiales bacterium]|nr:hypothetical protein [Longimicrobiales bacterium]
MPRRVANQLTFRLERLILRGPQYRLLLIAALLGLISVAAGAIIHLFDPGFQGTGFGDAVWWSFLRLSDPGYLGDDNGAVERTVSTILTVLGYVIFLGALVAIMTQWLNERITELEAGLTPIAQRGHLLLIGWTNRTPTIVRELVLSGGRLRRFLAHRRTRSLRIAILADEVTTALSVELRDRLGALWNERQVVLRTGSPLRMEHLRRVDFINAAAVIMPAEDYDAGGPDQADARTIKTLLSMTNHPQVDGAELPLAVVELFDSRRVEIARGAYGGPVEILASDAIIARLIAQNVRHPGLSSVYGELLTHGRGSELYVRECAELTGTTFGAAAAAFPHAILLGIVTADGTSFDTVLNPDASTTLAAGDKLVLLAHSYDGAAPDRALLADVSAATATTSVSGPDIARARTRHRVLVLGWNHKAPALLREFDSYGGEHFDVVVISLVPIPQREVALDRFDLAPQSITVEQVEEDYTIPGVLARANPAAFDQVVLLGSDRLASGEDADARSILAYLLLRDLLPAEGGPSVLVELLDAGNISLFRGRRAEVIISPVILSHMLAQVALRRELRTVFDELFGPDGSEVVFRAASDYGLADTGVAFSDIATAVARRGGVALGVRIGGGGSAVRAVTVLNPARDRQFELGAGDEVVVLT